VVGLGGVGGGGCSFVPCLGLGGWVGLASGPSPPPRLGGNSGGWAAGRSKLSVLHCGRANGE